MVCNIIDNCRCYAYDDDGEQFCGVRRGSDVYPCPADCCDGGCPAKYPFRIIERPRQNNDFVVNKYAILLVITVIFLIYVT